MTVILNAFLRRAASVSAVAMLALMSPASAQEASFSDDQLRSFVVAAAAINEIAEKWQPQMEAATTEDQVVAMRQQVETEMSQAIENTSGIGVDEYLQIMEAAQSDQALKGQIEAMMQEAVPPQ